MRLFLSFLGGTVVGAGFGVALGLVLFPYVFPPPPAAETLSEAERTEVVARGTFIHADPSDPIHWGKGDVTAYEGTIFPEPNFKVGPGPKYHVYLVQGANIRSSKDVTGSAFVDLGQLRSFEGSQKYPISEGVDLAQYPSAAI